MTSPQVSPRLRVSASPRLLSLLLLLGGYEVVAPAQTLELKSPNGDCLLSFSLSEGQPSYRVDYRGAAVVTESRLGLEVDGTPLTGLKLGAVQSRTHDQTWKPVYGEREAIRDHYRELTVDLDRFELVFRAYDEGVAFCYRFPAQAGAGEVTITRERSEFRFPADHPTWETTSAQGQYRHTTLSQIKAGCERPLLIQPSEDRFIAVAEARLVDYARMKLAPLAPAGVVSDLSGPVTLPRPFTTPWRVVMTADSPGRLLENNFLFLNLNDPCALDDTSWIRPGKVLREVTLTTTGGRACVDFAVRHGLQYVEFDAGWYGPESDPESDATTVQVDPKRSKGPLDLPEVIRYARERGIGILLYVNHLAAERQLDDILPLYEKWGVKGVKYGFVNVGSQKWTQWLHHAIRRAADHHLMVDVHDEYRPTGYRRTYPNFMTSEGISGDETSPSNQQTLTLQFIRFLAGPADNTICYYDSRVDRNATHAYQLAKAVCLYSPLQFLFWYDRPPASPQRTSGAGGGAPVLGEEPELEFFQVLPTVWDETRVLHGQVGAFAVLARRSGSQWFIGAMNAGRNRTLSVPLRFLDPGRTYTAHTYSDDPTVPTRTHVRIDRTSVSSESTLAITLTAQGGQAIRLVPVTPNAARPKTTRPSELPESGTGGGAGATTENSSNPKESTGPAV